MIHDLLNIFTYRDTTTTTFNFIKLQSKAFVENSKFWFTNEKLIIELCYHSMLNENYYQKQIRVASSQYNKYLSATVRNKWFFIWLILMLMLAEKNSWVLCTAERVLTMLRQIFECHNKCSSGQCHYFNKLLQSCSRQFG